MVYTKLNWFSPKYSVYFFLNIVFKYKIYLTTKQTKQVKKKVIDVCVLLNGFSDLSKYLLDRVSNLYSNSNDDEKHVVCHHTLVSDSFAFP